MKSESGFLPLLKRGFGGRYVLKAVTCLCPLSDPDLFALTTVQVGHLRETTGVSTTVPFLAPAEILGHQETLGTAETPAENTGETTML